MGDTDYTKADSRRSRSLCCLHGRRALASGRGAQWSDGRAALLDEWVRHMAGRAEIVLSVCTGSLILAADGLLRGLEATTHHGAREVLTSTEPRCRVVKRRVVDTGAIVTAAGVSAGIDGALHVVSRLAGTPIAVECASYMEYVWRVTESVADAGSVY